jgi:hypothetical protein
MKKQKILLIQQLLGIAILGFLAGCILSKTLWDAFHAPKTLLDPLVQTIQVVEAKETPFCFDPITCIRDVGEELGESNYDIMAMIRLAKCESGMRPDALNKNTNGTFDVGLLQINDVHSKRISRTDRMNFEKNIRFAYKLHQEQGSFNAWSCWKKVK